MFCEIGLTIRLVGIGNVGHGVTRANRIDADAVAYGLKRQRACELCQRALGCGIGGNAGKCPIGLMLFVT